MARERDVNQPARRPGSTKPAPYRAVRRLAERRPPRTLAGVTRFTAPLYKVAQVRWVDLPRKVVTELDLPPAESRGWHALLRFNGDLDRVTLLPGGRGRVKLAFKVELLRAARVDAGDAVTFTLERDAASREPDLPDEMRRVFRTRPELRERWQQHSVAMRRQVVRYIEQAKSPEVRARRCWIFLDRLGETGKLGGG